jgi:hypothetical protein
MQFVVPQFIEVESKVIGPISVRQFIILLATAGIIFIWYSLLGNIPFVVLSVVTFAIGGTFAFAKVNSQPFHQFALSLIQTIQRPRLSTWRREMRQQVVVKMARRDKLERADKKSTFAPKPDVSTEHIAELSLIVDTKGQYAAQDLEKLRAEQRQTPPPNIKPKP